MIALLATLVATAIGCSSPSETAQVPALIGRVVLPDGSPCGDCHTGLTSPDYRMPELAQQTGPDGSFEWSLPGKGEFMVEATGHGLSAEETVTVGSEEVPPLELRLK